MNTKQNELKTIVQSAINKFNANEIYLLDRDLSERCICAKFAMYLERELIETEYSDYFVDVEYNRGMNGNEYAKKMLHNRDAIVDLIVHKRGVNPETDSFDNLICIEMKKKGGWRNLADDKSRLQTMTNPQCGFNYRIGFMLIARKSGIVINDTFCNSIEF